MEKTYQKPAFALVLQSESNKVFFAGSGGAQLKVTLGSLTRQSLDW